MRVLCVWDTAGVYVPIAEWLHKRGVFTRILMRRAWDPYGQTAMSPHARILDSVEDFLTAVVQEILRSKPTIIHVNSIYEYLPLIRAAAPLTPIVYQYHGGDVRERIAAGFGPHYQTQLADKVIVSTHDLSAYGEWYDRPISDAFYYRGGRVPNTALMIYVQYVIIDQRQFAKDLCRKRGLDLTIIDRSKGEGVPYEKMPEFLSKFEYYLDFKGHIEKIVLSKTALEALACGCKVIQDAEPDRVITDAREFVRNNRPVDYAMLYTRVRLKYRSMLRRALVLARSLLFTRKGWYLIRILVTSVVRK
ncbi:MAG: hypothetical protein HXY34_12165 [Candidatus Thorarchaeota archaeon]|nr:hypothetical protein [Candidatus Thorarchaeota archaeon]